MATNRSSALSHARSAASAVDDVLAIELPASVAASIGDVANLTGLALTLGKQTDAWVVLDGRL